MANQRLRAALLDQGVSATQLADELGVDVKTVERWIGGREPYRRHRHAIAKRVGLDETYLWPNALSRQQVAEASESEVVAIYPRRAEVSRDVWKRFFESAEREIGILVYAGLFLAEDAGIQRILAEKAEAGLEIRILLGDPDSAYAAQRSLEEGVEDAFAGKIRSATAGFRRHLGGLEEVTMRLHKTILYNSIYRSDDQLLVNTHVYGCPAPQAPVWHLRKIPGGELVSMYQDSFEQVWAMGWPFPEGG